MVELEIDTAGGVGDEELWDVVVEGWKRADDDLSATPRGGRDQSASWL